MKIKKFNENLEGVDEPEVGDYVIVKEDEPEIDNFTLNNIGQIIPKPKGRTETKFYYFVQYEEIPDDIYVWFRNYGALNTRIYAKEEILFWGKNKEELKLRILANKYNL